MSDAETRVDLVLAEFVSTLISEAFEAVATSLVDQAAKHANLVETANLASDEFADRTVTDDEVAAGLRDLFPAEGADGHLIEVGGDYTPRRADGTGEDPPVFDRLGLALSSRHFTRKRKQAGYQFTRNGVAAIGDATRSWVAKPRHEALALLAREGIPRVVVDSGRVSSKVTFQVREVEEATPEAEPSAAAAATLPHLRRAALTRLPMERLPGPSVRMVVRQADPDDPQTERSGHVFGEVEITFKTVQ